jgi:hypothetical protein
LTIDFDPARHCGARAKQNEGKPCRAPKVTGSERCYIHGGKSKRGDAAGPYRHGERSKYVRTDAITEVLADAGLPAEKLAEVTMRANLADRRRRRADLGDAVDLDVAEKLDAGDRGDSAVLLKTVELARAAEQPAQGFTLTLQQPGAASVTVRTMAGPAVALKSPTGDLLLDDGRGNWVRAVSREVDGVDVWSALVLEEKQP